MGIQAICRQCGQNKAVEGYVMSAEAKKMVCAECAKSLRAKAQSAMTAQKQVTKTQPGKHQEQQTKKPQRPSDWDEEDERLARMKTKSDNKKEYRCHGCGYVFKYTPAAGKVYTKCPFCRNSFTNSY